jgi:hypothetical protein
MRSACAASLYSQQDDADRKDKKTVHLSATRIRASRGGSPELMMLGKKEVPALCQLTGQKETSCYEWWSYNSYDSYACKGGSLAT